MEPSPWSWPAAWGELLVVAAAAVGYAFALRSFPASRARVVAFGLGLLLALAAVVGRNPVGRIATHPFVALPLWLVNYGIWHVPAIYDAALRNHPLLHVEHACYLVSGLLLWWPVFQDSPHDLTAGRRTAYVFAAFILASPIGFFLSFLPEPIYAFYEEAPRIWGLSALADQQLAGALMSVSEAIVFFAVFAVFLTRFFAEEGA